MLVAFFVIKNVFIFALFLGSFLHLPGNFDSCLEADAGSFRGKYCILSMVASPSGQRTEAVGPLFNLQATSILAESGRRQRLQKNRIAGTVS